MVTRVSATLVICALAGGVAVVGLARPATDTSTSAAADTSAVAQAPADGDGDPYGSPAQADASGAAAPAAPAESGTPAEAAAPAVVTIEGFAFGGTTVAKAGQAVTVQNNDTAPHTMTARNGAFDSGTIEGGGSGTLTLPSEPGDYEFFCAIHPSMVSTITVEA